MRGSVLDCRSALPEIEAALEKQRETHEQWAEPLRHVFENADRIFVLKPYDELIAHHLSRVQGVIITFQVDRQALVPLGGTPEEHWEERSEQRELYLQVGGSSCDLLSDSSPTLLVQESVCCDTDPPSADSCKLGLPRVSVP
jgi:hypothetical protein